MVILLCKEKIPTKEYGNLKEYKMIKIGQEIYNKNKPGVKFTIVDMKRTRMVLMDKNKGLSTLNVAALEHNWDLLEKFNEEMVVIYKEKMFKNKQETLEKEREINNLKQGQVFIGNDNNKYVFIKMNRTRFECAKIINEKEYSISHRYNAKPGFVKGITKEILKEEKKPMSDCEKMELGIGMDC